MYLGNIMSRRPQPASYFELAVIAENLGILVHEKRRRLHLTLEQAGEASGVSYATIRRIEKGEDSLRSSMPGLLRWLGE